MTSQFTLPSPIQKISLPVFEQYEVSVSIKRDDLIHPIVSGNKWRKLKLNIEKYHQKKYDALLTFGGAFSNHIAATAYAGKLLSIPTIGIIRGDELTIDSNQTLKLASKNGMSLDFVTRDKYKERYERFYWEELRVKYGNVLIVEEGGANFLGMLGCSEILNELPNEPNYIVTAAGTGTTSAGLLYGVDRAHVISVPVFKNGLFIKDEIVNLLTVAGVSNDEVSQRMEKLHLETRFHFGGYGKWNTDLIDFMNSFYSQTKIPLDQIYTGKMIYAFMNLLKEGHFEKGAEIVLLHTGGLQGTDSIADLLRF